LNVSPIKPLFVKDYQGIAGHEGNLKNKKYFYDKAKPTPTREVYIKDYTGIAGNEGNFKNQKYFYDKAKPTPTRDIYIKDYQGIAGNEGNLKNKKYFYDKAKPTPTREVYIKNYQGISGNEGNLKNKKYFYDKAKPTPTREVYVKDYTGIAGNEGNLKIQKYFYDKARQNIRNLTYIKNYRGGAGTTQITNPVSYEAMYNATTNNNQEGLLEGRAYGPNKATNITIGSCDINMQIKSRTGYDKTRYGPLGTKQWTTPPSIETGFAGTTTKNQRDQPGVRQPEDFIVEQHRKNPYSQSLESAPAMSSRFVRGESPFNCPPRTFQEPHLLQSECDREDMLMPAQQGRPQAQYTGPTTKTL